MKTAPTLAIGSWSTGTLRPQDILRVQLCALASVDSARYQQISSDPDNTLILAWLADPEATCPEELFYLIEELDNILDSHCPPNHYWGSHPGDGADIGVWECE